jgi:hypothetical protein
MKGFPMKVRVLWVPPAERLIKCGEVYDLPTAYAEQLIAAGEAEKVAGKTDALPDPRPAPEPAAEAAADEAAVEAAADEPAA